MTEKNVLDVHVRMMEYEDLRSTMIIRHEYTVELIETVKDRDYEIINLK